MLWTPALIKDLAEKALELNKLFCGSRAISDSFTVSYTRSQDFQQIIVNSPYYWAVYYKDGVDIVRTPKNAKVLIWYVNPEDDPRIAPVPRGYPVKRADIKPFTTRQYNQAKLDARTGKAVFARYAGHLPAHDWTVQAFPAWVTYMKARLKRAVRDEVREILKPLRGLKIGP